MGRAVVSEHGEAAADGRAEPPRHEAESLPLAERAEAYEGALEALRAALEGADAPPEAPEA
ncbi:hypothetical protein [Gulosibacter sp. 10]|uniref:hypothetical protein n=1 Tax=Gulosibacter sp. 10 TaxID=1255570 RepID=UPI0011220553|nr:hypothetical protein [Gulosibacter sp. 10]